MEGKQDGELDAPCLPDGTCSVRNSFCNQLVCKCLPEYFDKDDRCEPKILIGDPCSAGEVCLDDNAECGRDGVCACKAGFYKDGLKCSGRGRLGFPCLADGACADFNAVCRNGVCVCGETYYELDNRCYERGRFGTPCLPRGFNQLPCVDAFTVCGSAGSIDLVLKIYHDITVTS